MATKTQLEINKNQNANEIHIAEIEPEDILQTEPFRQSVVVVEEKAHSGETRFRDLLAGEKEKPSRKEIEEEIRDFLTESLKIQPDENMLHYIYNALYYFYNVPVHTIMIDDFLVTTIDLDASLEQAVQTILHCGHSRIPITQTNPHTKKIEVLGILYVKDLLPYILQKPTSFRLNKIMRPAFFVPTSYPINRLLDDFKKEKKHMAIVINEEGEFVGIVTLEDIIEELLGDFEDEFDKPLSKCEKIDEDTYLLDGRILLRDLIKGLDIELEDESHLPHRTLYGFLFHKFGRRPKPGEEIVLSNYLLKVKSMKGKYNVRVILKKINPQ